MKSHTEVIRIDFILYQVHERIGLSSSVWFTMAQIEADPYSQSANQQIRNQCWIWAVNSSRTFMIRLVGVCWVYIDRFKCIFGNCMLCYFSLLRKKPWRQISLLKAMFQKKRSDYLNIMHSDGQMRDVLRNAHT